MRSLLLFAHADEAQAFEDIDNINVTGVGKINATKGILGALRYRTYNKIILLGTAGILDRTLSTEIPYPVGAVFQHDLNVQHPVLPLQSRNLLGVEPLTIATGDSFITDTDYAEKLYKEQSASLVDMETYAYADICKVHNIKLEVYKIGSDFASTETTHQEWDDIVKTKSEQLREFYDTYLANE